MFDTHDYRRAMSSEGPHAYNWNDKPHRLIYDLCSEIERLQGVLAEINETVRIPTPQGTRAYTHFMRDFDKIRSLTAVKRG